MFLYEKNLQGDIVAVYNARGDILVSYDYDAWGEFYVTYYNDTNESSTQLTIPSDTEVITMTPI